MLHKSSAEKLGKTEIWTKIKTYYWRNIRLHVMIKLLGPISARYGSCFVSLDKKRLIRHCKQTPDIEITLDWWIVDLVQSRVISVYSWYLTSLVTSLSTGSDAFAPYSHSSETRSCPVLFLFTREALMCRKVYLEQVHLFGSFYIAAANMYWACLVLPVRSVSPFVIIR